MRRSMVTVQLRVVRGRLISLRSIRLRSLLSLGAATLRLTELPSGVDGCLSMVNKWSPGRLSIRLMRSAVAVPR